MPFTGAQAGHGRMDTTKGRTRHAVSQLILKLLKCVPVYVFDFEMMMAFIAVTAKDYSTVRHRNPTGLKLPPHLPTLALPDRRCRPLHHINVPARCFYGAVVCISDQAGPILVITCM